eukprot:scaffold69026_cov78-Phaeocystis_antarctica.AAC.7
MSSSAQQPPAQTRSDAEALEPGGRLRPELRQACSRQAPPWPSAAESAAAKAFADGGACAMLARRPDARRPRVLQPRPAGARSDRGGWWGRRGGAAP